MTLRRHQAHRAFTLLELLVVITIIVLLVAILMPVLSNVRESARTTACLSTLRQQGIAVAGYATDNRDHIPFRPQYNGDDPILFAGSGLQGPSYEWLLSPYVNNFRVPAWTGQIIDNVDHPAFWCPGAPILGKRPGFYLQYEGGDGGPGNGYQGAMRVAYTQLPLGEGTPNHNPSKGPIVPVFAARLTISYFTRIAATPLQFCSDVDFPTSAGGTRPGDVYAQQSSWHWRRTDNWIRPTMFLDGHTAALTDRRYTDGAGHNIGGHSGNPAYGEPMMHGPYTGYELANGEAYNGKPPHKPFDFWLDEY